MEKRTYIILSIVAVVVLTAVVLLCRGCHKENTSGQVAISEDERLEDLYEVVYPGRSFSYSIKFNDRNKKHLAAAQGIGLSVPPQTRAEAEHSKGRLREIKSNRNYVVDELTHSVPYLVPQAAARLDSIGIEFADILNRNGLPHYRFRVTSVFRTAEDIAALQKSGNINSINDSPHNYATTFDLAYTKFDKVTNSHNYMTEDNLKLVLGQVLLNQQRAGNIYVKYEWKQSCFHVTAIR
jgi:hypothetical protein